MSMTSPFHLPMSGHEADIPDWPLCANSGNPIHKTQMETNRGKQDLENCENAHCCRCRPFPSSAHPRQIAACVAPQHAGFATIIALVPTLGPHFAILVSWLKCRKARQPPGLLSIHAVQAPQIQTKFHSFISLQPAL